MHLSSSQRHVKCFDGHGPAHQGALDATIHSGNGRIIARHRPILAGHGQGRSIPVKAHPGYLHMHANGMVQFTSPDPDCMYCLHANPPFDTASTHFDNGISFVQVQWTPWYELPAEARMFGIAALPSQIAYKNGARIHTLPGDIAHPLQFINQIKTLYALPAHQ